jgi:hypothetical protein
MNDYEVKIFTRVYDKVAKYCADNQFISDTPETLAKLPAGCLYEMDNATVRRLQTSTPVENYSLITYQLEFFAGKRETTKKLARLADKEMIAMNFTRMSGQFIPNLDNPKVKRWVGRYEAVVDRDGNLYRI